MPTPTPSAPPSTNGELINRVQQLRLDGQLGRGGGGRGRGAWLPWVLCGIMAVAWAGVGVRWSKAPAPGADAGGAKGAPAAKAPATGSGDAPQPKPDQPSVAKGELLFPIKGTLVPFLQINLSPEDISGTVTEIFFKEGDPVEKDKTILATIRDDRYRNDFNAAKSALESAQNRYQEMMPYNKDLPESVRKLEIEQAQAEWDEAEANRLRAQQEIERLNSQKATGVISKQDLEKADADLRAAGARVAKMQKTKDLLMAGPRPEKLKAALADIETARARFAEAERLLRNCTVRSPITGTVLTKVADKGVLVSPMSFNVAAGICSIADLSDLEAEIEVREDQISQIKPGLRCEVVATADQNRVYAGRIDRIMPIADDTKNVIKVRVKVQLPAKEVPGSFLKPKMSTTVRVYNVEVPPFTTEAKK